MTRTFEIRHTPNADLFDQFTIVADNGRPYWDKIIKATNDPVDLFVALADWLVPMTCPACDWFGFRDDCKNNSCPNCRARAEREKK